jgi:hypothetical protein
MNLTPTAFLTVCPAYLNEFSNPHPLDTPHIGGVTITSVTRVSIIKCLSPPAWSAVGWREQGWADSKIKDKQSKE